MIMYCLGTSDFFLYLGKYVEEVERAKTPVKFVCSQDEIVGLVALIYAFYSVCNVKCFFLIGHIYQAQRRTSSGGK